LQLICGPVIPRVARFSNTLGYPMQPFQGKKLKKPPTGRVHGRQMMSFLVLQVLVCRMNHSFFLPSTLDGDLAFERYQKK
ncbi:MAG: hypothetical protein ACLQBD_12010, partial [Syntrophobacteraceae bacterium]